MASGPEPRSGGSPSEPRVGLEDLLDRGVLHEWLGLACMTAWQPPVSLLAHWARAAALERLERRDVAPLIVWVGRRVWPAPHVLLRMQPAAISERTADRIDVLRTGVAPLAPVDAFVLDHAMLIDPPTPALRVWAIDLALRSPAVAAVVGDGSGFDIAATRRLQLAARSGARAAHGHSACSDGFAPLAVLARPAREQRVPSTASTRWVVTAAPTAAARPAWRIDLVRSRSIEHVARVKRVMPNVSGMDATRTEQGHPDALASFFMEWDHAHGPVAASPRVVDRSRLPAEPMAAGRVLAVLANHPARRRAFDAHLSQPA